MDGLGVERSLRHVESQDVAPMQHRGLCLGGRVQVAMSRPSWIEDLHEGRQLALHPRLQGPETVSGLARFAVSRTHCVR